MNKCRQMRDLLKSARPLISPGIYDGYSGLLAQAMGFKTASTTGAGLANSLLGQPDIGLFSLRDNVDACRRLTHAVDIPLMADADTGYGNAVTVFHVVQYFEEAGVVGINIEDQFMPKRCGAMRGKELVEPLEMALKIEAALKAKKDPDFIINARTDAIAKGGDRPIKDSIEDAIGRGRAFLDAGAALVFVPRALTRDVIEPLVAGLGHGKLSVIGAPGALTAAELQELGVARVSYGPFPQRVALRALQDLAADLYGSGVIPQDTPALN